MRKLLQQVNLRLNGFLEQREAVALVVQCSSLESTYLLKALQAMDEGGSPDFFWLFTESFDEPRSYVSRLVRRFQEQQGLWQQALEKAGEPRWPEVPAHLLTEKSRPVERLRGLMRFARDVLAEPEGQRLVWGLFPSNVAHLEYYARFVAELLQHEWPAPWCHHMRILVRAEPGSAALESCLRQQKRLQWYAPDLSLQAMERGFEEEAGDESQPLPVRMQALLVLAGGDQSQGRHAAALEKYRLLLRYHQALGNHPLSALVLNGMGEVHLRAGQGERAQRLFESALTPALEGKAWPVLLNITLNLANLKLARQEWKEAEAYHEEAGKLATGLRISSVKIQCLENRGYCQYKQGDIVGAARSWHEAASLARSLSDVELLRGCLRRIHALYKEAGLKERRQAVERELATLDSPRPRGS